MKKKILYILLLVTINACNRKIDIGPSRNTIDINTSHLFQKYNASDIFDVEYIALETNESCLVGIPKKIVIDSLIYISDSSDRYINIFRMDGSFFYQLNRPGRGPGEYLEISDFTIDSAGEIVVLDGQNKKLLKYTNKGDLLDRRDIDMYADAIELINDSVFVFNGSSTDDKLIVWDNIRQKRIYSDFPYDEKYSTRLTKPLIKDGQDVYFCYPFSSTIFKVTYSECLPDWTFNFGKYNITDKDIIRIPGIGPYVTRSNVIRMNTFTSTPNYLTFRFECEELGEYPFFVYISRIDNGCFILNREMYYDDLNFNINPPIIMTKTGDNKFVEIIQPYHIKTNMVTYDTTQMNENQLIRYNNLEKFLDNITETDNPIIGLYTLKTTNDTSDL